MIPTGFDPKLREERDRGLGPETRESYGDSAWKTLILLLLGLVLAIVLLLLVLPEEEGADTDQPPPPTTITVPTAPIG